MLTASLYSTSHISLTLYENDWVWGPKCRIYHGIYPYSHLSDLILPTF